MPEVASHTLARTSGVPGLPPKFDVRRRSPDGDQSYGQTETVLSGPARTTSSSPVTATQIFAVLMCAFGWLVPALPWTLIGLVWLYVLAWMVVLDLAKLGLYRLIENRARHHRNFLHALNQPLSGPGAPG